MNLIFNKLNIHCTDNLVFLAKSTNSQNGSGYEALTSRSSRNIGALEPDDFQKKPVRLESLAQSSGRQARKKGRGLQNDQYDR